MRRNRIIITVCFAIAAFAAALKTSVAQGPMTIDEGIAFGTGGQLYPFDRQDPWLHGQFQRIPAYGGFASFRPYNYRHVMAQTQISSNWGAAHGMPYSHQFWNRYRGSYLNGNLTSQNTQFPQNTSPASVPMQRMSIPQTPVSKISYQPQARSTGLVRPVPGQPDLRPVHIYPNASR